MSIEGKAALAARNDVIPPLPAEAPARQRKVGYLRDPLET
jgi:hypothetical protein